MDIADKKTRQEWIHHKHMKAFNFYKEDELKEVDIIIDSPISFEEAQKTVLYIQSGDIRLPVISIDNLIKMKQRTARLVDKWDIQQLKLIKKLRKQK